MLLRDASASKQSKMYHTYHYQKVNRIFWYHNNSGSRSVNWSWISRQYSIITSNEDKTTCTVTIHNINDIKTSTQHHWVTRPEISSETDTESFFETKYFQDRYRDFFSRLNIFETDTETFFETRYFRDRYRDFFSRPRPILSKNWEKSRYREVSIPRSLETRCHTLTGVGQNKLN